MRRSLQLLIVGLSALLVGCAGMFISNKQNIVITTGNKDAEVYLNKEQVGKGLTFQTRVKKEGSLPVVVTAPGYKNSYYVVLPTRRPTAYWVLYWFNLCNYYGLFLDPMFQKNVAYSKSVALPCIYKLKNKEKEEKYIELDVVSLDIKNAKKDIYEYDIDYSQDLKAEIEKAENNKAAKDLKQEAKDAKKKKKAGKTLNDDDNTIKYDNTIFADNITKTLKKTGYIDTVNHVFADNNNTLILSGSIKKINAFAIRSEFYSSTYYARKARLFITWYIKTAYDEIVDSIQTKSLSGEFLYNEDDFGKMLADGVDASFLELQKDPKFIKYIKAETNFKIKDAPLSLTKPTNLVKEVSDAASASVIVKNKDGHGSGFAVTNDGYIITNYHVIAGKYFNKFNDLKVVLSTGEELPAKIIRYNRYRDVALLKVDATFEKAFEIENKKTFKNLQEVYTIGAPKSIELGQSVSIGLISNERKVNNNNLIQLSMSVNPGNSGGPLFDKIGVLHGIIVSKLVGYATEGVGFAVPSYQVADYLNISYQ